MSDATHQNNPHLTVFPSNGKFQVRDQDGGIYGTYDTQTEAEENLSSWEEYYAS